MNIIISQAVISHPYCISFVLALVVIVIILLLEMPSICLKREGKGKSIDGTFFAPFKRIALRRSDKVILKKKIPLETAESAIKLAEIENADILKGRKIKRMYNHFSKKILNACASHDGKSIFVSASWYAALVWGGARAQRAFRATLAHEIGHQVGQIPEHTMLFSLFHIHQEIFIGRTNEVRCDYYGVNDGLSGNLAEGCDAMKFKREQTIFDCFDLYHPSWKKREKYISAKSFDEELIKKIAKDVGYKDQKVIHKVVEYYKKDNHLKLK